MTVRAGGTNFSENVNEVRALRTRSPRRPSDDHCFGKYIARKVSCEPNNTRRLNLEAPFFTRRCCAPFERVVYAACRYLPTCSPARVQSAYRSTSRADLLKPRWTFWRQSGSTAVRLVLADVNYVEESGLREAGRGAIGG
ncbi:hypothetical protein EVAR_88327_1 [Eumeta japonica]|uniref:Uncharacterized protein n=1 Tax=Eumeta variegata TaxID=151549 RepID=A0A4C1VPM0_EUMVA|nr:hypothetical protein EVAR_88327_1 [Eumeta japonica]